MYFFKQIFCFISAFVYLMYKIKVFILLEQGFVQCWRRSECAETAGQQQPASPAVLLFLQAPNVVNQLDQDLVPQSRTVLALLQDVVTEHLLLPTTEV